MKLVLAVLLLASSCWAQNKVPPSGPEAACGPSDINLDVKTDIGQHLPPRTAGQAIIYFVQTQRTGPLFSVTAKIGVDGAWAGATKGDSYLFVVVEPGDHHFCASWQSKVTAMRQVSLNNVTAEAGKSYYFRIRISGGDRAEYSLDLEKTNSDEGQLLIDRSPFSVAYVKK
jgi:hypothetical protein